ncbi:MAG: phosphohydrolase [Gracilibacter sp. BRH_c7a]|nr:MAG: phosphohydrolase [Gracilibacter sp. BRH_c7a]
MSNQLGFFRILVAEKLSYERFQHSVGVEVLAGELAEKFGLDVYAAQLAAITHDLAKSLPYREQLKKANEWKLIHYPEDIQNPQVIHGRISAYILKEEYGVTNQDILNAVANHTLGRPNMSDLEMLIYSADLTEPGRNYDGVDKLREKLYYDLREGTLACMEYTLSYLRQINRAVHPLTVLAYQDLKNKLEL